MTAIKALILVTLVLALLTLFRRRENHPRWARVLPALALLLVILHGVFEHWLWQMAPAYAMTVLLFLLSLRRQRGAATAGRGRKIARYTGLILAVLVLAISGMFTWLLPVFELPKPSGPHPVGTQYLYLLDHTREEYFTADPSDRREISAQIWYPAAPLAGALRAPYLWNARLTGRELARSLKIPSFMFDHLALVREESWLDAPFAATQASYPVLIFSHGYAQGNVSQNTVQMRELASHGYVVVSIAHPYEGLMALFPDGRAITASAAQMDAFRQELTPLVKPWLEAQGTPQIEQRFRELVGGSKILNRSMQLWVEDTRFVIDELTRLNPQRFRGRLDLERLGVFGMSFGGATAAQICLNDRRVKAGANLDGLQFGDVAGHPIQQPFMFMDGGIRGLTRKGQNRVIFNEAAGPAYQIAISDAMHLNFSDMTLWSPGFELFGFINGPRMEQIMNAYLLAFFNQHLLGKKEPLMQGPAAEFPEVLFESRGV